jgi:nucleoside-triphosphatase
MTLNQVLQSSQIVLGTIYYDEFPEIDKIKKQYGVKIFSMTDENRDLIPDIVANDLARLL